VDLYRIYETRRKTVNKVPVYMTLGESPGGEFDIRVDVQKNAEVIRIPVNEIDMTAVSFTYPDSMYELPISSDGWLVTGGEPILLKSIYTKIYRNNSKI